MNADLRFGFGPSFLRGNGFRFNADGSSVMSVAIERSTTHGDIGWTVDRGGNTYADRFGDSLWRGYTWSAER